MKLFEVFLTDETEKPKNVVAKDLQTVSKHYPDAVEVGLVYSNVEILADEE